MAFSSAGNLIGIGPKNADQKLDRVCKSHTKSDPHKYCQGCGNEFNWHTWRNNCDCCDGVLCRKCLSTYSGPIQNGINFNPNTVCADIAPVSFAVRVCDGCWEPFTQAMQGMIVVRSGDVGGHITREVIGKITSDEFRDFNDAEASAKFQAYRMGGNAIMKYTYTEYKNSKPADSGGTYYYSTFSGNGVATVVEPK